MSLLADLNARYTTSAFRFEVLRLSPGYDQPVLRSIHNDPYLLRVAQHVLDGKQRDRALVVDLPLSAAMARQLDLYRANVAVGERTYVVVAGGLGDSPGGDFWLFDEGLDSAEAVLMHYDDEGRVTDREHVADPMALRALRTRAIAGRAGTELGEFLAAQNVHGDRCAG